MRIEKGKAALRRALALPERLRNAPPSQVAVAALYYGLYLLPAATALVFGTLYLFWMLSGLFLATAVRWLWAYGGITSRLTALMLNAASAFANLLLAVSLWVQGTVFDLEYFFHADWETLAVASGVMAPLFFGSWAYWFLVSILPCLLPANGPRPKRRAIGIAAAVGLCLNAPFLSLGWLGLSQAIAARDAVLVPKPPHQNIAPVHLDNFQNLVLIFAESLESAYSRADIFGEDLTPALSSLAAQGLQFTNMRQVSHTGWSTGAMIAAQCATGLSWTDISNARMRGALCLGDLLAAHGYRTVFMTGTRIKFAGLDSFHASHGFVELHGLTSLARQLEDPHYRRQWGRSDWGLYDDSLFTFALEKLATLEGTGPFALALATMDTHGPRGFPSKSCAPAGDATGLAFAVRCADQLIAGFIQTVRTQFPNTLIVLLSDHLTGNVLNDPEVMDRLKPYEEERRLRFQVWGPGIEAGEIDRAGTHFDVMPSLMDFLGMTPWTRHNLGASLLRFDSPWFLHENPDSLRVVHRLPGIQVLPGDELTFRPEGPMIELDGQRILATSKGLALRDALFALELDASGGIAAIRHFPGQGQGLGAEAFERWAGGRTVIGISSDSAFNRRALGDGAADLAFFAGPFGTPHFVVGPLQSRTTVALPRSA